MSKRTIFTTITPLPSHVTRETVIETLHTHTEMIDLNPLVIERHPIKPPGKATAEEFHCTWYSITDRISYLPGGLAKGKVTYDACFHDLANGLQTHVYAPAGLDIKEKWSVGGSLPGEPQQPTEIGQGIPLSGLYLREDIDMTCNFMMTSFVKKTLQGAHSKLIGRLVVKTQLTEKDKDMERMTQGSITSSQPSPHLNYANSVHSNNNNSNNNGMMSPGFPSPGFQQGSFYSSQYPAPLFAHNHQRDSKTSSLWSASTGHMSYQNDPRMSMASSSGSYQGFSSPNLNQDPAFTNANPYQQQQGQGQGQGQFVGYPHQTQQYQSQGGQPQQQAFAPSELASNDGQDKGKASGGSQGFIAELPAEYPEKATRK